MRLLTLVEENDCDGLLAADLNIKSQQIYRAAKNLQFFIWLAFINRLVSKCEND